LDNYKSIRYVSQSNGSDKTGTGSQDQPWASISHALSQIQDAGTEKNYAILIAEGRYLDSPIQMKSYVDLYGGYDSQSWERNIQSNRSVITGNEERRICLATDYTILDGFVLDQGRVRGKGAAIFGSGVSPVLSNNVFIRNRTLAPNPWNPRFRHEITNDGGAVYFENGSSPVIENNLFVDNLTENGRGAAIAFHSNCNGRIINNIFLRNKSGLDDPRRSSDGGAVSIFDWSDPLIEGNIFLSNRALSENDAGAMFVALWSSPVIKKNIFVDNSCEDDAGALFVGGQEHRYDAPLDPLPSEKDFFVSVKDNVFIGNSNPSRNSGVTRFTMEGRGEFTGNITAFNTGVYFQRSEVLVENNLILDNFQLIETKEGFNPSVIRNNVIWGDFLLTTDADVTGNSIKGGFNGNDNIAPGIIEDWILITPASVTKNRWKHYTEIFVAKGRFKVNELINRVVRARDQWSVIKSNDATNIEIWGDLADQSDFKILPTYRYK
jgi:hypothetical protein